MIGESAAVDAGHPARGRKGSWLAPAYLELALAAAAFLILCVTVLTVRPQLPEPDDYAYRASIVAVTDGHFLTLSTPQVRALAAQITRSQAPSREVLAGPGPLGGSIEQWVRLPGGRWISEKDPGYPFLAAPFQALGIIRLAPLWYGALACLGLFFGARRWLGHFGGSAAVGLFCSCGAAFMFAWRDYMPTFTEAALIAAGSGALLWAMMAEDAAGRRRTAIGLLGFMAIEGAVFARYTDIVFLGCAVVTVLIARWRRPASVPSAALWCWLGSAVLFGAAVAVFDDVVYGGPLRSGYRAGEIVFSLGAIPANVRQMPVHLIQSMPVLILGVVAAVWIAVRRWRLRHADGAERFGARRDFAVGSALAACWFGLWGGYSAYDWTTSRGLDTLQVTRFYAPAIGAIALLGAWLLAGRQRGSGRIGPSARFAVAVGAIAVLTVLGVWSFHAALGSTNQDLPPHCVIGQHCPGPPPR